MANILEKIIKDKKETLRLIKKNNSLDSLENKIKNLNNYFNFKETIQNNKGVSLISEIKKSSPSAGILIKDFNHLNIAKMYVENGATCLSVLSEEKRRLINDGLAHHYITWPELKRERLNPVEHQAPFNLNQLQRDTTRASIVRGHSAHVFLRHRKLQKIFKHKKQI